MTAIAASSTAMTAIAASAIALNRIFKASVGKAHAGFLGKIINHYATVYATVNNSSYFTVTNSTTAQTNQSQPFNIDATGGVLLISTYQMNNYGGAANDSTGTIKHMANTGATAKTWSPGTGNSTTNLNVVAVGGANIAGSGQYPGKVAYGTYTWRKAIAK